MSKDKSQSGVSLFLTLMIMTILLAMALGLSAIFLGQVEIMRGMGHSVIALYAADAGIERVLMIRRTPSNIPVTPLPNGATYQVFVTAGGTGGCAAPNFCIRSIGTYKEVRRAIEINY